MAVFHAARKTNFYMKKIFLVPASVLLACTFANAQHSFPGYRSANYTGVNAVFFNPANTADSRMRWDVNLAGINAGVSNNKNAYDISAIKNLVNGNADSLFLGTGKKPITAAGNFDLFGPSVLIRLNSKSSFAITTRVRTLANITDLDGQLIDGIKKQADDGVLSNIATDKNQRLAANGWADIGLAFGRVLYDDGKNFLKAGVTLKYLGGIGNSYLNINKLNTGITKDASGSYYLSNATGGLSVGVGGVNIDNANSSDYTTFNGSGFGADIGAVYEYRPDGDNTSRRYKNKYLFKAGLALLDIGKIKYSADPNYTASYSINVTGAQRFYLTELDGKSLSEIKQYLDTSRYFKKTGIDGGKYSVALPSTLQVNLDYCIDNGFYVDAAAQFSLSKSNFQNSFYQNNFTITPRFEARAAGVYLPLNYNSITGFNAGLSLSAGPLFVGSGSLFTALFNKTKQADVHVGLRFGSFERKRKKEIKDEPETVPAKELPKAAAPADTDGDGIIDTEDKCVTVPGVAKYQGCPVPDTDGDGINDEEDKCVTIPGVAKYQGCPVPDTDGDGINDEADKCVTVAGLAKYEGCPVPDTDGDGVNDEEDKCINVPGEKTNMGCPLIKADVVKKINFAAKNILFQTGKAILLPQSFTQLDKVAAILKEDENIKLNVEGHTDNAGKPSANLLLSEKRAAAVRAYLIKKGIDENRLTSKGFGDTAPVVSNKTAAGKKQNRRVEMKANY